MIPILQQTKEYLLVEPMIQPVYELHIIRIGKNKICSKNKYIYIYII